MRVSSARGAQRGPPREHRPSPSLNALGNPGLGRTQAEFWLQRRPGSGSGEDTGQPLPQEHISGKGGRNRWSQEAATQTAILPGRLWQSRAKRIPGLLPALLLSNGSCACSRCPFVPCQTFAVPAWSTVTLSVARVPAGGSGSAPAAALHPAAAPPSRIPAVGTLEAGAAEAVLRGGCVGCSPQPAALRGTPAEPPQPQDLPDSQE